MTARKLDLVRDAADELARNADERAKTLSENAWEQGWEGIAEVDRDPNEYLRLPYTSLDGIIGGLVPGDVGYVCAFSGSGKTTLLMNITDQWLRRGQRVYYMGLESQPKALRVKLACLRVGVHDGDVLTGEIKDLPGWEQTRKQLVQELADQSLGRAPYQVQFDAQPMIDGPAFERACRNAAQFEADVLIVDHIDHVSLGDSRSLWEESVRVNRLALDMAQRYELRLMLASQCNNESLRGDPLGQYKPPRPQHVKMGSHKREVAAYMIGLYRPLRDGLTKEDMQAVRDGSGRVADVLAPNTMGVVCMKHRYYGEREGRRCTLHVERGKVSDIITWRSSQCVPPMDVQSA